MPIRSWRKDRLESCERCGAFSREERSMAVEKRNICAHEPCACTVAEGEKYCSNYCRTAGSEEVEIACECDHEACQEEATD